MTKVVINKCYGGFGLSKEARKWIKTNYGENSWKERHDEPLVACVEALGEKASGKYAKLQIQEINSNRYRICEYDGAEWIETPESIDWIKV